METIHKNENMKTLELLALLREIPQRDPDQVVRGKETFLSEAVFLQSFMPLCPIQPGLSQARSINTGRHKAIIRKAGYKSPPPTVLIPVHII